MIKYDNNGNIESIPNGFPVPQGPRFELIEVTHDESSFYENDRRKVRYWHPTLQTATLEQKGEGQSIMISDFLTIKWGRLIAGDE